MAILRQRSEVTTTVSIKGGTVCHSCRERKPGLYTVDAYGKPMCADCARAAKRPID